MNQKRECPWCGEPFKPHPKGLPKTYCSREHKDLMRSALFDWAEDQLKRGNVTVAILRTHAGQRREKEPTTGVF